MSQYCVDVTVRCALALGYFVTLFGDGHGPGDVVVLPHDEIAAHHNNLLCKIYHLDTEVMVKSATDISFSYQLRFTAKSCQSSLWFRDGVYFWLDIKAHMASVSERCQKLFNKSRKQAGNARAEHHYNKRA